MVDIHSHILWGLDDGARTLSESMAMVRMAAEHGTTDLVATPHANQQYAYQPELIEARILELAPACGGVLRLHRGCDFHLSTRYDQTNPANDSTLVNELFYSGIFAPYALETDPNALASDYPLISGSYSATYTIAGVGSQTVNFNVAPVPEPGSYVLLGLGLEIIYQLRRRKLSRT